MVKQYPHTLKQTVVGESVQDGSGNWVPSAETITEKDCRFEPSSGDAFVKLDNGTTVMYDGIVYLPLPAADIAPGTSIEVMNGATVLSKGTVKRFSAGQLNARLWL